jgi:hypothetical protein
MILSCWTYRSSYSELCFMDHWALEREVFKMDCLLFRTSRRWQQHRRSTLQDPGDTFGENYVIRKAKGIYRMRSKRFWRWYCHDFMAAWLIITGFWIESLDLLTPCCSIVFKHPLALLHFTLNNTFVTVQPFILSLSFFTTCFGPSWPSSGVFTLLKLLYCTECQLLTSHALWCFIIFTVLIN